MNNDLKSTCETLAELALSRDIYGKLLGEDSPEVALMNEAGVALFTAALAVFGEERGPEIVRGTYIELMVLKMALLEDNLAA